MFRPRRHLLVVVLGPYLPLSTAALVGAQTAPACAPPDRDGTYSCPAGSLQAAPNPCALDMQASPTPRCWTVISASTSHLTVPDAQIEVGGINFACRPANTGPHSVATGDWITAVPATFSLYGADRCGYEEPPAQVLGPVLAEIEVFGVDPSLPRGTLTADLNPCLLPVPPSAGGCASTIGWSSENVSTPKVAVKVAGLTFRCVDANTSGEAATGSWISATPLLFTIHPATQCPPTSVGPAFASLRVWGTRPIRGVAFEPLVSPWPGDYWLNAYDHEYPGGGTVRDQVIEDLGELAAETGLTHLWVGLSANNHLDWPVPDGAQLERIASFVDDARDAGFKVVFNIGNPYQVRRCKIPDPLPPGSMVPVCGYQADPVACLLPNGFELYWDVPDCTDDSVILSKRWYRAVIEGIESRLQGDPIERVAVYEVGGLYSLPFATEINALRDSDIFLQEVQHYLDQVIPYLQTVTEVPIGISLLPDASYDYLDNLLAVVPIEEIDYLDVSSDGSLDPEEMIERIGGTEYAGKLILSDFLVTATTPSQCEAIQDHIVEVREHGLGGWWYWLYRDRAHDPGHVRSLGLRDLSDTGGWRQEAADLIASYPNEPAFTCTP